MIEELVDSIRYFGSRGWVPATSSNFSVKASDGYGAGRIAISISGRDKNNFTKEDLMWLDPNGNASGPHKPSAETPIHLALYEWFDPVCVMHTHSPSATVLSKIGGEQLEFTDYELLKGLGDIHDHNVTLQVPIFKNSQDMVEFVARLRASLSGKQNVYGFLIQGHGLYTWGRSVLECRRHIEVFEFLFECRLLELRLR